ncbi:type II secretion system F family protein [Paenibacillus aestuarii]|uniref:Type II secretion system F family protein n=1 Tax=Paenibacillus aestuarii TaxID=516965 RepID=A0ABW0K6S3_9BACL
MAIQLAFIVIFVLGILLMVNPLVRWMSLKIHALRRNRFYYNRNRKNDVEEKLIDIEHIPLVVKLDEYASIAEIKMPALFILLTCFILAFSAFIGSYLVFPAPGSNLIVGLLFGLIPLLYVWSRFQKKQQSMAMVMIPTIQNFIGYFTEAENLESAIYKSANHMPFEIQSEWNRLILDFKTGTNPEAALITFAKRAGNDWANDFADILITHLDTGVNITSSLFKLVNEMQNAIYNEEKRLTLLTAYKWGTFLMIALSIFVVFFNISMDPKNKYYYFVDPFGIKYITFSIIVLFISFVGALHMGKARI